MIIKRVSRLGVTIDVLSDVWTRVLIIISEALIIDVRADVGIDALTDVLTNLLASAMVGDIGIEMPEFTVAVTCVADVLIGVRFDALIDAVYSDDVTIVTASGVGVGMLTDVDANVLAAVIVPSLSTDSGSFS